MIRAEKVTKRFGEVVAVEELNLHVPEGELFCFLGPNGAGKTTTIKMFCGLLRPTAGRISVGGMDVHRDGTSVRKITGYIPDTPYLYERLTVSEFFRFTGRLYRVDEQRMAEEEEALFAQFGLMDHRDALIRELSHGLRQRLVYASTLLQEPKVLFIDEPFVGLDPYTIRLIKSLLREKTRNGTTIFLTTHILALAEDMADRIGIIRDGRLAVLGTLEEIRQQSGVGGRLEDVFLELTGTTGP